jgi:DNA-binding transcriptional ArsR family regulator
MSFARPKAEPEALNPTLWRTCRVLANKTRLRILAELFIRPKQRVSDIAQRLKLSLPLASQSLRALSARGLLRARRTGSFVYYSPIANRSISSSEQLLKAIQTTFTDTRNQAKNIFKYSTAFTHPRRILIVKTLHERPMDLREISLKTNIPIRALCRHLHKLDERDFLIHTYGKYACRAPYHKFARILLKIAINA